MAIIDRSDGQRGDIATRADWAKSVAASGGLGDWGKHGLGSNGRRWGKALPPVKKFRFSP
jgi:hypothetical protein